MTKEQLKELIMNLWADLDDMRVNYPTAYKKYSSNILYYLNQIAIKYDENHATLKARIKELEEELEIAKATL